MPYKFKKLYLYHVRLHKINIFLNMSHKCANSGKNHGNTPRHRPEVGFQKLAFTPTVKFAPYSGYHGYWYRRRLIRLRPSAKSVMRPETFQSKLTRRSAAKGTSTLPKLSAPDAASNW